MFSFPRAATGSGESRNGSVGKTASGRNRSPHTPGKSLDTLISDLPATTRSHHLRPKPSRSGPRRPGQWGRVRRARSRETLTPIRHEGRMKCQSSPPRRALTPTGPPKRSARPQFARSDLANHRSGRRDPGRKVGGAGAHQNLPIPASPDLQGNRLRWRRRTSKTSPLVGLRSSLGSTTDPEGSIEPPAS